MNTRKRLGILTSGGDCPGLNAVIRAVLAHAIETHGWEVVGIPYSSQGLMERQSIPLDIQTLKFKGIDTMLNTGGTILKSINPHDSLVQTARAIGIYVG